MGATYYSRRQHNNGCGEKRLFQLSIQIECNAQVVKLVDTPASGAGGRKAVEVRVFSWAPFLIVDFLIKKHVITPFHFPCAYDDSSCAVSAQLRPNRIFNCH